MTRRFLLLQFGLTACAGASLRPESLARRIFNRINELRVRSGVDALVWSTPLARCATEQCLRKDRLRFPGHNDPERGSVSDRLNAAGFPWSRCGENIFSERGYEDPVHFAVVSWWYSPGHKENLLNPEFTETGVGVAEGADGTFFVTQIFVHPAPVPAKPAKR